VSGGWWVMGGNWWVGWSVVCVVVGGGRWVVYNGNDGDGDGEGGIERREKTEGGRGAR
jgi:hypothetical protein